LASLAREHRDIADDFSWMKAILGRDSPAATLLYVDLFIEGMFERGPHAISAWHVGRELAKYVEKFPEVKTELKKRYEAVGSVSARAMLEYLFGEVGDDDDFIAMVKRYAAAGQAYDGRMAGAVQAVALRKVQENDRSSSYYIHPASVAKIRKFLFGLLAGGPQERALAKSCLTAIDELRDEHGIAANDTRHPDVMSDLPWPLETG
jgi:hypothetical protein